MASVESDRTMLGAGIWDFQSKWRGKSNVHSNRSSVLETKDITTAEDARKSYEANYVVKRDETRKREYENKRTKVVEMKRHETKSRFAVL